MKVTLFYKLKYIEHKDEKWGYCRSLDLWHIPKTYIRRIYVNAVDNPEYPVPLGYWEWTIIERRPTLKERWVEQIRNPKREQYDCTVPNQIAEKILTKLGWEDFKLSAKDTWWLKYLSDEKLEWPLLAKHLINETEFMDELEDHYEWQEIRFAEAEAEEEEIKSDLPEPAMLENIEEIKIWEAEVERRKAERMAEKKRKQAKRIYEI